MTRGAHRVPYGRGSASFEARDLEGREVTVLEPEALGRSVDGDEAIRLALETPMGSRLRDLARGARSAAILVPGIDRVAAVGRFVPALLVELRAAGVPLERTTIHLATGTHHHHGMRDLRSLLGDDLVRTLPCVVHDPKDQASLVRVGETSRGTQVVLSRAVVDADVKILTGRVIPHYFAGFGGGRKALLPGVAAFATILENHKLTLAPERGIAPNVAPCSLEGNPVHLDMLEAMQLVRPTFALNMLLDTHHDIVDVLAGEPDASHAEACRRAVPLHQLRAPKPFDALITSAGGAPYDCSFVQALKAVLNVKDLVRPGGAVLWVAECPEGIAPAFLEWAKVADDAAFEREARSAYNLAAHNTVMLRGFLRSARVAFVSALDPSNVSRLGLEPMATVEAGVAWLRAQTPPGARVAVVPFANVTHGIVGE
jgi:nickel-dependent lactate racemase